MSILDESYARDYVVITKTPRSVVLRVLDDSLYASYWKEFISAKVDTGSPMYLRIEQAPPEVTLVDQYAPFTPELPLVTLEANGERIDMTGRIVSNTPNTEVPGLFRIDYRINISHEFSSPIWAVYVSVQQCPILRKAAAGWVRDSYIVRTLNRLVMEPQFMEALHAAGEPLYGFMEANQHPSIKAANLPQYAGLSAWGAHGVHGGHQGGIFITGQKLPQGTVVVYQRRMLQLREPVWPDPAGLFARMDGGHERAPVLYAAGDVVRAGDASYICIQDTANTVSIGNPDYWRKGYLYKFGVLDGDENVTLDGCLPVGEGGVEHIWAAVDSQGYSFWVDILNRTSLGVYRGYYNRKDYADYCTGDIVSYISEGAIKLFERKATDIQPEATLEYPPGHHLNPAWEEIYVKFPEERRPLLSEYHVIPHTNAANAIVAKTWSVSEEMCQAYGNMMGIPPLIVKECGAKWSALLFALLSRTRNTFEGLRVCLRAVGLDIENLELDEPSIEYECNPDGEGLEAVGDIYTQHANLRRLLANITTLAPEGEAEEKEGALRYVTENTDNATPEDIGTAIQQYSNGEWVTRYRFRRLEPSQNFNNRYYKANLVFLSRLAEDAVVHLGDGDWVKEAAWAGRPSELLAECLSYEIPIYVYLRLRISLYAETRSGLQGFTYSGIFDGQRCGAKNILELFPSKYFSRTAHDFVEIETGVYRYEGGSWILVTPTRRNEARGSKIYEFHGAAYPLRIRALHPENYVFIRYWQSTHTFGLLGVPGSGSTVNDIPYVDPSHFHNVTAPDVTDESSLILMNGHVGVTAQYMPRSLAAVSAIARSWKYILNDSSSEETWALSDTEMFAELAPIGVASMHEFEGSFTELVTATAHITASAQDGAANLQFAWDGSDLVLYDCMPDVIYFRDAHGVILCAYGLVRGEYTMTEADWAEYRTETPMESVRVSFAHE